MSMTTAQTTAFQATGGFLPVAVAPVLLGLVFALLLLWGAWAISTAYKGWARGNLSMGSLGALCGRFLLMYLFLAFFLL